MKPTTPPLKLGDAQWIEWGGAVRWLMSDLPAAVFRGKAPASGVFSPLTPALHMLHRNLKQRFDPKGILNRGRLYPDF